MPGILVCIRKVRKTRKAVAAWKVLAAWRQVLEADKAQQAQRAQQAQQAHEPLQARVNSVAAPKPQPEATSDQPMAPRGPQPYSQFSGQWRG